MNHDSKPALSPAALASARRSACPGLVRVVAARDGGLCRIRLVGGVLTAAQAHAIAQAALAHASGTLELTNRANVQVRGVRAGSEAALTEALVAAGLGPEPAACGHEHSGLHAADELRNLMMSPLAGLDPDALIDTIPFAAPIVAMLQSEPRFAALSPKFALLLDGGERLAALDHPHDIWLAAAHGGNSGGDARFVFGLAGCPGDGALGAVASTQAPALIRAMLHAFLDLAQPGQTRMREVLAAHDADAVLQRARHHADVFTDTSHADDKAALHAWRRASVDLSLRLGAYALNARDNIHASHLDDAGYVGCQPPLARLDSATLHALAALAEQHGDATLRITPWQGAILPNVAHRAMPEVLERLRALGLVCDSADPLARTIACTGSAGCAKSRADTKADALRIAAQLPPDVQVHLSGCERSCAAAHQAPFTLLATEPGHYDLYERDMGTTPFGHLIAHDLTIEAAARALAQRPRSTTDV
ncbi:precorrin-3B synthase [Paraburkholderia tagetis]|uniref:Precorrin-3B synthase n=1 Tax=Paraburkholderia tagetis TaxID=2913261 RepID=A0A9X1RKV5_9BURK|nr:precorrin-3B synthase [Paraburkholderia tagetis]MCG5073288.1 precorrin-3B synthase [Paraburkholderia tagetis]